MATITLRGVTRRYEGGKAPEGGLRSPKLAPAALLDLDLDVADGELLVLVGPSGCGKSTALRLIAGLDTPDAGTITMDGRDMRAVPPQDRDVAMVFQGYALYPHLTVREIIAFPLKMRGVPAKERDRRVEEAAASLGLTRLLGRRPGELSGGERQRVAMGRAIVRSPKAFLFDEPLSNLDAALRAEIRVELAALVRRLGTTSIYVTHDQIEAMTLGDRIAVLQKGVLQQIGAPRTIYEDPANVFVAGFLGTPPMNLIELDVEGQRAKRKAMVLPLPPGMNAPARVTAGIRPEHLRLGEERGAAPAARPGEAIAIEATVIATEPLGAETFVYLDADGARLRARAQGWVAPARGDAVKLSVMPGDLLWFDAATGERCRAAPRTAP
jgi:multiple sugar transport system ATP-binding protein